MIGGKKTKAGQNKIIPTHGDLYIARILRGRK